MFCVVPTEIVSSELLQKIKNTERKQAVLRPSEVCPD
jgi:hypothetical protein